MQKANNFHTPKQAKLKAMKYCAYQERCQQEVRNKLHELGVYGNDAESIITELISENFINEERFATLFAGGKFRIKKWGKIKIQHALKQYNISEYCINKGFKEIGHADYIKTLKKIIADKKEQIKAANTLAAKKKIIQYAISKGYESDLVWEIINNS